MSPQVTRPRKTLADLRALPDETPAELICGEVYVTPSPSKTHQRLSRRIYDLLAGFANARPELEILFAPFDVHLPTGDIVQPDLLVTRAADPAFREDGLYGPPDLVVEIVSPSHPLHDRVVKRDLYARSGVPEYWIVDPEEQTLEVLRLDGDRYQPAGYGTGDQTLTSPTLEGLTVPLADLFV